MYPKSFTNKIKEEKLNFIEIRSNLNSVDDIKQWVNEYGSFKYSLDSKKLHSSRNQNVVFVSVPVYSGIYLLAIGY